MVAVIVLALGIGASTAVFSILYAVSLRPLPYKDPDQLVVLSGMQLGTVAFQGRTYTSQRPSPAVSGPDFLHWQKQSDVFSALAALQPYGASAKSSGQTERLQGYEVTPEFFRALGVEAATGRLFAAGDEQPGRDHVVVLGPGFASHGSLASGVNVGGTLELNGQEYDVIGGVPSSFRVAAMSALAGIFPKPDVFVPIPIAQLNQAPSTNSALPGMLTVFGRLKPGVTIAQAQTEMSTIASRLAKQYPALDAGAGVRVASMQSQVGQASGALMTMLLVGVGFLLLIACVNIAVLLLTQGARRRHEIAVRQAVGASTARIVGHLFSESLFLALAGGAFGVLFAFWLEDALVSLFPPMVLPLTGRVELNWQVLAFALGISVGAAVLFGLIPALQIARSSSSELLKEGSYAGSGGVRRARLRNAFVVCEVTLAFALLIVCGLMIRGITGTILGSPSYNAKRMLMMNVTLTPATYPSFATREGVYRRMLSRLDESQLVESSALEAPTMGGTVVSTDKPVTAFAFRTGLLTQISSVTPGYFDTMQIPLMRGRAFTWADYAEKPSVAIVNQTLASTLWPNENPIGKHITTRFPSEPCEVVGVAGNAGMLGMGFMKSMITQVYLPELPASAILQVRTAGDGKASMAAVHDMAAGVGPGVRVNPPHTMDEALADGSKPLHYTEAILDFMGLMALLLATVGVSAVTAYAVTQRTHDIGVRMALGARQGQVLLAVMKEGTRLSIYGVGIGLLLALGLGRVLMHYLRGVGVGALSTYFGVALLLLVVTVAASYIAARRATHIDPVEALRCE